jgi:hypothetical protein
VSDWIPTTEQMPPDAFVLIAVRYYGYRDLDVNMAYYDPRREEWRYRSGARVKGDVTHWMALPAPPVAG